MSPDHARDPAATAPSTSLVDAQALHAASAAVQGSRRWVVKIGSALLTRGAEGLDEEAIEAFADALCALPGTPVLVSSGAVAAGLPRLGLSARPTDLSLLQAAAAVGQMGLIQCWERALARHGRSTALVLLTHEDVRDRSRYLNARNTLRTLLARGVIPVVNENDTVATDEIRLGDNDTLAALVANLVEAEVLALLTDVDGLRAADPSRQPDAERIAAARVDDPRLDAMVGGSAGVFGRGGMRTKLSAARLAARSGAHTLVVDGRAIRSGSARIDARTEDAGSMLIADQATLAARKRWIAGHLKLAGELVLDAGAVRVLREAGRSLLPVGITAVRGCFERGDVVACVDGEGVEIARGLANYAAGDAQRIQGCASDEIAARLGFAGEPEMIHRDNMVLV